MKLKDHHGDWFHPKLEMTFTVSGRDRKEVDKLFEQLELLAESSKPTTPLILAESSIVSKLTSEGSVTVRVCKYIVR